MAEEITYYAIFDDYTRGGEPAGVLRRFADGDGRDETFGRDLEWKFSSLFYEYERGDLGHEFVQITADEVNQIVARIRELAQPAG